MFENDDGQTDAGVIGILIAHLVAFDSGELKKGMKYYTACKELILFSPQVGISGIISSYPIYS